LSWYIAGFVLVQMGMLTEQRELSELLAGVAWLWGQELSGERELQAVEQLAWVLEGVLWG
jgi:hypothetical protein